MYSQNEQFINDMAKGTRTCAQEYLFKVTFALKDRI